MWKRRVKAIDEQQLQGEQLFQGKYHHPSLARVTTFILVVSVGNGNGDEPTPAAIHEYIRHMAKFLPKLALFQDAQRKK